MTRIDTLPNTELLEVCQELSLPMDSLEPLQAFENFVFLVNNPGEERVLRVSHRSHRSTEDLQAELSWTKYLRASGASIAAPLPIDAKRDFLVTKSEQYLGFLMKKALGQPLRGPNSASLWGPALYQEWGRTLGQWHRLTRDYQPPSEQKPRYAWDQDRYVENWKSFLAPGNLELFALWDETLAEIRSLPRTESNFGLIHSDLHYGNFYLHQGELQVFDTDDCQYHWFVADIATILSSLSLSDQQPTQAANFLYGFLEHFGRGYCQENHLSQTDLTQLSTFVRFRELVVLGALHAKLDFNRLSERQSDVVALLRQSLTGDSPLVDLSQPGWQSAFVP